MCVLILCVSNFLLVAFITLHTCNMIMSLCCNGATTTHIYRRGIINSNTIYLKTTEIAERYITLLLVCHIFQCSKGVMISNGILYAAIMVYCAMRQYLVLLISINAIR